ncbi:MAG: VWA domain-containing protein [Oscillospiraceae bacterium]|nr:VWA domain-containing protein [Oscillospiraceae bacterium]
MAELEQTGFGGGIESPNEPHMACVLLVDTSGSMAGEPIRSLNDSLNRFKSQTSLDQTAQRRVDIAIVSFGSAAAVVQDFTPISLMTPITLKAAGATAMGAGINLAVDMVKERNQFYNAMGTPCFKPWIFMITDGIPTDDIDSAVERVQTEERKGAHGRLKFWSLAVGNADTQILRRFSERVMQLDDMEFAGIFNWLSESMVAISVSRVGDVVNLNDLPDNARVVPSGW